MKIDNMKIIQYYKAEGHDTIILLFMILFRLEVLSKLKSIFNTYFNL